METRGARDFERLLDGIAFMRGRATSNSAHSIVMALWTIRRAKCLPDAYLDGIQDEMLQMLAQPPPRNAIACVYLAFHGLNDRAEFLKIGVAADVKKRMRELYTGNPLPRLWTFSAEFNSRSLAYRVETALHKHMRHEGTSGEWFKVRGFSEDVAEQFVSSLAEVAGEVAEKPVGFARED